MKTLLALSFLVSTTVAVAGPSVTGGVLLLNTYESCSNKKQKVSFRVDELLRPKNFVGYLSEGKTTTGLKCKEGRGVNVFVCDELRAGEGQLRVTVKRKTTGEKYAEVSRKDILNRSVKMYDMSCDQQVSN